MQLGPNWREAWVDWGIKEGTEGSKDLKNRDVGKCWSGEWDGQKQNVQTGGVLRTSELIILNWNPFDKKSNREFNLGREEVQGE